MGPLGDKEKKAKVVGLIEKGVEEGAKLKLDGRKLNLNGTLPLDAFLNPSVFTEGSVDMTIGKEEIFGPVANVIRAKNFDDAVGMVESSIYGNAASIFTNKGRCAVLRRRRYPLGNSPFNDLYRFQQNRRHTEETSAQARVIAVGPRPGPVAQVCQTR